MITAAELGDQPRDEDETGSPTASMRTGAQAPSLALP